MDIIDFEAELRREIHQDIDIKPNPFVPGMAGVYFKGQFLCACPARQIFDEPRADYCIEGFEGRTIPHRTRPQVLKILQGIKGKLNDQDYLDALFGTGAYSDEKLGNPKIPRL